MTSVRLEIGRRNGPQFGRFNKAVGKNAFPRPFLLWGTSGENSPSDTRNAPVQLGVEDQAVGLGLPEDDQRQAQKTAAKQQKAAGFGSRGGDPECGGALRPEISRIILTVKGEASRRVVIIVLRQCAGTSDFQLCRGVLQDVDGTGDGECNTINSTEQ